MPHTHWDTIKGLGTIGALVFAQVTANMQTIDWTLRMFALLVTIAVGLANLRSILKDKGRGKK